MTFESTAPIAFKSNRGGFILTRLARGHQVMRRTRSAFALPVINKIDGDDEPSLNMMRNSLAASFCDVLRVAPSDPPKLGL